MHLGHKKTKNSVAGASVLSSEPIIPPGIEGIPPSGNLYAPLAGLGTNQNQSLQVGHPLERRTTSRERRKRRSLDEYVSNLENESCTEDGIPVIVDSSKKGVNGTEASEERNLLHGASVPSPPENISGVEVVEGAPSGAPSASSTQIPTPHFQPEENSLNPGEKIVNREGPPIIVDTSAEEDKEFYTDTETQDSEAENDTVLQGSPKPLTTAGITALTNLLITENPRSSPEPSPDPRFKSTPKKKVTENKNKEIITSPKGTPGIPEIITKPLGEEHRNTTVPEIIVHDIEDAGKDDKSRPEVSS